jgi:beta-aspartyl-peptidase (threonine type)
VPALLLGLTVVLSIAASAQTETDMIQKVLSDQVDAWNRGEVEGYMKGYWASDSTVFLSGGTLTRGYDELLARYRKSYGTREKMGRLAFSELTIRILSERAAMATGIWRLHRATDEPWGRFTLIFEKKPEGWRITHDHTSLATE